MQIPGETFYVESAEKASWIPFLERAGFTVDDRSHGLTEAGRQLGYSFSGRLTHGGTPGKSYVARLQREEGLFALRIASDKAEANARLEANAFVRKILKGHLSQRKTKKNESA